MAKKKDVADTTVVTKVGKVEGLGEKNAYILFLSGPLVGKLHPLQEGETILGRAPDIDVPINDNRVSRKHVSITVNAEGSTLRDLGSTNGTFVNGQRVEKHLLQDGDKIQLSSSSIFKFAYQDNLENVFHKELYRMAVLDPLTGIYNKRYFTNRLNEEFSHSLRIQHPLSLLMMDLDRFKEINDTHGHLAGDCALTHVANTIKKIVRVSDIFARYGGEEFAAILRNTDTQGAWQMAERIREMIEKNPCQFESHVISLTISLGVVTLRPASPFATPKEFLEAADQLLYLSKKEGRNRTTMQGAHG